MLVTPGKNRRSALTWAALVAILFAALGVFQPWCLFGLALAPLVYGWIRRKEARRLRVMAQPFPRQWEAILQQRVAYFGALDEEQRERFRQMTKVFLDETRITGIRTEVDETTRVLVAASAIIPVLNLPDWEYSLGEVLIYPDSFDEEYRSEGDSDRNTLGMVGAAHLSGVMILSKPALWSGFDVRGDRSNVGIHEFAHLVDKADGSIDGIPPGVPPDLMRKWIEWVGTELRSGSDQPSHIKPYAYTNEAEYFAVLVEYFFESPSTLKKNNPELYSMLEKMFRQDTASLLRNVRRRPKRISRNVRCPCGSGKKYKRCCRRTARQGVPRTKSAA